nr:integrase, catalytic region, zinc finger, CCHC-type, peptidase aspartic, catalytic [Tanacetum cinerariifolium]
KFVGDFKSLAKEAQTELERTKERFENCIIKKKTEYAKLYNDWYKKCDECKYDKISYDKAYKDMQQKIKRLQAQLGVLKGKSKDTSCVSDIQNQLFKKVSDQKDNTQDSSKNTKFAKQPNVEILYKIDKTNALSKPVTSNSVSTPRESKGVNNEKVIAPGMFRISSDKVSREAKKVPNTSRGRKHKANVSKNETQKKYRPKVSKPKNVGTRKSLATPKPRKPGFIRRWSPTGKMFDSAGKLVAPSNSESHVDCSNGDNACTSNAMEPKIKRFPNSTALLGRLGNLKLPINFVWKFIGTVRFGNDHVAAILGFGDLQWGNIVITRVYFVEGLGHNLFSVGQFCDSDLEVAFRRNACLVRNLEGVDLLKGDRSTNLYTINLHEMA